VTQFRGGAIATEAGGKPAAVRIVRHAFVDRVFHWVSAVSVLILLGTAFLPILGIEMAWVEVHWTTGVVLFFAVLFHVVRSLFWKDWRSVWIGRADFADLLAIARSTFRASPASPPKPGKYSIAQKLIHHVFALVVIATLVTGALMLARVDTPWLQRNPYLLGDAAWGVVFVVHGLAALLLITMVMMHIYFALRPEKLLFTRSMILGWITREEYVDHHDPKRWQVDR
jgi:cytochrome b subunit of formate dehydrogenase